MSNEVKRYSWHVGAGCMIEETDCAYVESEDYEREVRCAIAAAIRMQDKCAALEAECERLADELARKSVITGDCIARCQRLADERDALAAELAAIKGQELRADPVKAQLLEALEAMCDAFMILLRTGHDRIIDLGGTCDSVSLMAEQSGDLRIARAAIAAARKEGV